MMTQDSIDRTIDNRVSDQAAESTFREVDATDRAIPSIELRNVTMVFDDRKVLNDLSFKVMKGETKIILGGSGCGKSTTIKLVLRSEERRVGKECRSRWSPYHSKKKH